MPSWQFILEVSRHLTTLATPIEDLKKKFFLTATEFTENELKEIKEGNEWLLNLVATKESDM